MKKNKVLIISVDALNTKDLDFLKTLPTFNRILKNSSYITGVKTIYPSLTYPSHTSICTGVYPDKHGINNNEIANPKKPLQQDWYWYKNNIKVPTLFDYAENSGYEVASVFWPVMAGANFKFCLPEMYSPDKSQSLASLFLKYGSKRLIPILIKYKYLLNGISQPALDNFAEKISHYVLEKSNFIAIHFTDLDATRHNHGLESKEGKEALKRIDKRIYRLLKHLKRKNSLKNATIVILGDHGTHSFNNIIEVNTLFKKHGLINLSPDCRISRYKAYANTCGGSCQIHLNPLNSYEENEEIEKIIKNFSENPCIKELYKKEDFEKNFHLKGKFNYILEAADKYVFRNSISDEIISAGTFDHNSYMGDHGYLPSHEDMQTMFIISGKNIKKNFHMHGANVVDFAPTIAKAIDIEMKNVDGKIQERIFKDGRKIY